MQKGIQKGFKVKLRISVQEIVQFKLILFHFRLDNDESDEYCPYCDNHYVLPAVEPEDQNINLSELLQQQLLQFNDPRMKAKFADLDEEFEALLQE